MKERMSIEELRALKPSIDNPVELVCDDGQYVKCFSKVSVIAVGSCRMFIIDCDGSEITLGLDELKHYPSKKQPKFETLYECVDDRGLLILLFGDGQCPEFTYKTKEKWKNNGLAISRKTGREFRLNMEDWSIEVVK